MPTEYALRNRVHELTKEQCEYIVRTLHFLPRTAHDWTTSVPYYYLDSSAEEILPIPVERGGHHCQDWWDYMEDVADEWQCNRWDTGWNRSHLNMRESMPPKQEYYRNTIRLFCHRPPYRTDEHLPVYGVTEDMNTVWYHYQTTTALNTPTIDHVIADFVEHCVRPLALFVPTAMSLYNIGYKKADEIPCCSFIGKGLSSVTDVWREIGGTISEYEMPDSMPWWVHFRIWELPSETYHNYMMALNSLINRARHEWLEDYEEWIKDIPIIDKDADYLENSYKYNHFIRSYEPKEEDEDEDEDEDIKNSHVICGENHEPIPVEE